MGLIKKGNINGTIAVVGRSRDDGKTEQEGTDPTRGKGRAAVLETGLES